jgi:hypothetical protein
MFKTDNFTKAGSGKTLVEELEIERRFLQAAVEAAMMDEDITGDDLVDLKPKCVLTTTPHLHCNAHHLSFVFC